MDSTDKTSRIEKFHTSCQDCIFSHCKEAHQVGCRWKKGSKDKIDEYRNLGISIVEAYNNRGDFYILNGIKCHYKRTQVWSDKVPKNKMERVLHENRMKYQAIIFAENSLENIEITVQSLMGQKIPPQHITIVRYRTSTVQPSVIAPYLEGIGLPWKIENILDDQTTDMNIIDKIMKFHKYPYYVTLYAWTILPQDFIEMVNTQIYDKNFKFAVLVDGDEPLPVLTSTSIHYAYGGNNPTSLVEKLTHDKMNHLILDINTIEKSLCLTYPK